MTTTPNQYMTAKVEGMKLSPDTLSTSGYAGMTIIFSPFIQLVMAYAFTKILEKVLTLKIHLDTIKILYETSIECTDSNYAEVYYDKRRTS
ncbi:MAG: hypothetical protein K5979_02450 [Ruminococcus sp.]|nr:hypothetical protein [Ruminococcus sp.]